MSTERRSTEQTDTDCLSAQQQLARLFDIAAPMLASGALHEGTLMGHACLRTSSGDFVATVHRATGDLVVKLSKQRVGELVDAGTGSTFAPNGRVFSEWVALDDVDDAECRSLLDESIRFQS